MPTYIDAYEQLRQAFNLFGKAARMRPRSPERFAARDELLHLIPHAAVRQRARELGDVDGAQLAKALHRFVPNLAIALTATGDAHSKALIRECAGTLDKAFQELHGLALSEPATNNARPAATSSQLPWNESDRDFVLLSKLYATHARTDSFPPVMSTLSRRIHAARSGIRHMAKGRRLRVHAGDFARLIADLSAGPPTDGELATRIEQASAQKRAGRSAD